MLLRNQVVPETNAPISEQHEFVQIERVNRLPNDRLECLCEQGVQLSGSTHIGFEPCRFAAVAMSRRCNREPQISLAIERLKALITADPKFQNGHHWLGIIYLSEMRYVDGIRELELARQLDPGAVTTGGYLAYGHAKLGDRVKAGSYYNLMLEQNTKGYSSAHALAIASLGLGNPDQAIAWLEESWERREDLLVLLPVDPSLQPLRSNPRFKQLLARIHMKSVPRTNARIASV